MQFAYALTVTQSVSNLSGFCHPCDSYCERPLKPFIPLSHNLSQEIKTFFFLKNPKPWFIAHSKIKGNSMDPSTMIFLPQLFSNETTEGCLDHMTVISKSYNPWTTNGQARGQTVDTQLTHNRHEKRQTTNTQPTHNWQTTAMNKDTKQKWNGNLQSHTTGQEADTYMWRKLPPGGNDFLCRLLPPKNPWWMTVMIILKIFVMMSMII